RRASARLDRAMSVLRSLRAQGAALLLALVLAMGLVYGVAAFSALRETTGRVASEGLDQAHALARRYDGLLQLGAERPAAVAVQPIVDLTGKPAGALLGEIDFDGPRVAAFARELGAAALVGPGGTVLSSSLPQGLLEDPAFRSALPPQEGTAIVDALGS